MFGKVVQVGGMQGINSSAGGPQATDTVQDCTEQHCTEEEPSHSHHAQHKTSPAARAALHLLPALRHR